MEENLFPSTVSGKLYKERAVLIGTFIGGPLVGGYLIAQNFYALNEPAKAGKTWVATAGVFLLLVAMSLLPPFDDVPAFVYSLAFCLGAHAVAKNFQGGRIALHQAEGGAFYGTGRAVWIGFLGCALMAACLFGLVYLIDPAA